MFGIEKFVTESEFKFAIYKLKTQSKMRRFLIIRGVQLKEGRIGGYVESRHV